jgi:stress-induced-phosphoprotein 1
MADALKAEGNKLFAAKDFAGAAYVYSLYSNRSGAYASLKNFDSALEDANKTTELKADWAKGWGRKGAALHGVGNLVDAVDAFEHALQLEPTNAQAKSGLESVRRAIDAEAKADGLPGDPSGGIGKPQDGWSSRRLCLHGQGAAAEEQPQCHG